MSGGMQGGGGVPETLLDTKGQIHGYSTENVAVDVGTNDFTVYADSSATPGLAYGASAKSLSKEFNPNPFVMVPSRANS